MKNYRNKMWHYLSIAAMLAVVLALLLVPSRSIAAERVAGRLVDTAWLYQHMKDPKLVIVDASRTPDYIKNHIRGAISASFPADKYLSYGVDTSYGGGVDFFTDPNLLIPFQDGPPKQIEEAVRSLGIDNDSTVVVYDKGADLLATRFFWTLNYFGLKKIYVLNGGLAKWMEDGYPITKEVPTIKKGTFKASVPKPSLKADTEDVLALIKKPNTALVSGLLPNWHYGTVLFYDKRGHIPYAIDMPFVLYFQKDKTWKPVNELKAMFEYMGITPDKQIITHCGGGVAGNVTFFTMKYVMGYPNVRMYLGSMLAWLADPRDLTFWTYDNEHSIRNTDWMQWWAGERIQYLTGEPKVIAVDARSKEKYKAGHIAYAVNIPVPDLMALAPGNTGSWEEIFGKNGVSRDKEVVIYDEKITPQSTYLFWLLEYFGQKKVSIYNDGLFGWTAAGYKTTDKDTVIAKPTHTFDVAISPTAYKATLQGGKCLADQKEPVQGKFPRLWLIASESLPATLPAGPYKHIAWKNNLTDKGMIKSATDLWDLYEKAGVSKFSEIVCYSESIPEATMTYFALRAIGFPNVRVYVP
jgi:thiosulfate/3-mercaptopyruvate sulfurtransferase